MATGDFSGLKRLARVLLGGTALTLSVAGLALAQEAPAPEEESGTAAQTEETAEGQGTDTITVTATRRKERVLDVPYNISAVPGAVIEGRQMQDNVELLRSVPGVAVVDRGYRNTGQVTNIRMRGLNIDSSALGDYAVSAVSAVSTYINDTPLFANAQLKDLDRVEILRGPQGTLYGSGSLGGTVRYIARSPELDELSLSVSGSGSAVEPSDSLGWAGDAVLNAPLGPDMALRIVGSYADYPGLTDYANVYVLDSTGAPSAPLGVLNPAAEYQRVDDADTVKIGFVRASLLVNPTEDFSALLTYTHQSDEIGGRRYQTPGTDGFGRPYQEYAAGSVQLEPSSRDLDMGALEVNVDFGFATLTSSTSYYDHRGDSVSENTGFYAQAGFLGFYYNYPRPMASAVRGFGDQSFVQEVRLVSNGGSVLDYVVGAYYQDQDLLATQDSYLRGFKRWWDAAFPGFEAAVSGDQDFGYRRDESFVDKALFGELTWHVTDRFQVTGGVRYFDNESKNTTFISLPLYTGLFPDQTSQFQNTDSDAIFKFNASLDFGDDDLAYFTVSEGYRRGGTNAVPTIGFYAEDPRWQTYDSDSVTNYEAGVKGMVAGIRYGASVFYVDWDSAQLNTATPTWGFFAVQNGGKAHVLGVELEVEGYIGDAFHYGAGYTYTDAKLTEDVYTPTGFGPFALDGARLPGTPEHQINLVVDYTFFLEGGLNLTLRGDAYYQSETRNAIGTSPLFDVDLDDFAIFNASATLSGEVWDMTLWLKNVANEEGITGVYTEAYMGSSPADGYYGNGAKELITLPRTVGLTVSYHF